MRELRRRHTSSLEDEQIIRLTARIFTDLVHLGDGRGLLDSIRRKPMRDLYRNEGEREVVYKLVQRLVDARLRPAVEIDSKSVKAYYRDQFVPKLKQAGTSEVPLTEVSAKIRELLTQQKVSELLVSWLQTLRSEGQVRVPGITPAVNDSRVQSQ